MAVVVDSQPLSMSERNMPMRTKEFPWDELPKPLRIDKRSNEFEYIKPTHTLRSRSPSSTESDDTNDASFNRIPESSWSDIPLTIPKRRADRNTDPIYEENRAGIAPAIPPKSQQRSTSCTSPRRRRGRSPLGIHIPQSFHDGGFQGFEQAFDGNADPEILWGRTSPALFPTPAEVSRLRNARSMFQMARHMKDMDDIVAPPRSPVPDSPGSSSSPEPPASDPFVLVPRIVVTPEHKALDQGAVTLWAAVQISTQISRANAPDQAHHDVNCGWASDHNHEPSSSDLFRYGCLYDVSVDIMPTVKSTILEVVDDKACAISTLYPGSRLLVVVHVRLSPAASPRQRRNPQQSSDDLMEDLEHHLGSTMTEYLQVRLNYRHSGFPQQQKPRATANGKTSMHEGITSVQTTIQTTATAVIKRHNASSPWAPRLRSPQPNPLFEIIASHWGVPSATEVMQRVASSRPNLRQKGSRSPPPLLNVPFIPSYMASLAGTKEGDEGNTCAVGILEEEGGGKKSSERDSRSDTERPKSTVPRRRPVGAPPARTAPPLIPVRMASLRQVSIASLSSASQNPPNNPEGATEKELPPEPADSPERTLKHRASAETIWSEVINPSSPSPGRTSYRLSKVRRVPSSLKGSSPPASPITASGAESGRSGGRMSGGGAPRSDMMEKQQQRGSRGRRRSQGGDGARSSADCSAQLVEMDEEGSRDRGRSEKSFTSMVTTTIGGFSGGNMSTGVGGSTNRKGKREKEKDKDKGWSGWSGWWQ
ncbi:hypothetical protein QBC35DRAFT_421860 [Podospora australis]|uniref:Uncharacterized protein n=1 Tax=Podospora australis TaxID=1536484 RepID=A0AAN6X9C9_9PEZI|nr:hypothetical protein QBC35DRAFT_421860 [Podospora australis]